MAESIGRYEIISEIGRGGMATVYLGFDPRFRRQVAVKVLPRQFTHDPQFLARFNSEAQMIAGLEDRAIVPVYDFGEDDDAPFLVMRYMGGGSLRDRLHGGPFDMDEAAGIVAALAPALDLAHERGIIHRDLKPANVLFDQAGYPYLADFGIARMAEATHTMTIVGTPAYMSPEQAQGKQKLDGRSDIYAMGVMLFELLTGKQPYVAETPTGQMIMHILEPVPDILQANDDLPAAVQLVIDKSMAKEREERYGAAAEMANHLTDVASIKKELATVKPSVDHDLQTLAISTAAGESDPIAASGSGIDNAVEKPTTVVQEPAKKTGEVLGDLTVIDVAPAIGGDQPQRVAARDRLLPAADTHQRPRRSRWLLALLLLLIGAAIAAGLYYLRNELGKPNKGDTFLRQTDEMTMVYVPAGSFKMGSEEGSDDERPIHEVSLDAFWLDRTEVSNNQYERCIIAGNCQPGSFVDDEIFNGDNYPVVGVSWQDAVQYCAWVNGRLPSEAEWEYATRGPKGLKYPWGNEYNSDLTNSCDRNCPLTSRDESADDGYAWTAPVGSYPQGASWTGALDMAGNITEWVNDWYGHAYYSESPADNPQGPGEGIARVRRGGSWVYGQGDIINSQSASSALSGTNRANFPPDLLTQTTGFRCRILSAD